MKVPKRKKKTSITHPIDNNHQVLTRRGLAGEKKEEEG